MKQRKKVRLYLEPYLYKFIQPMIKNGVLEVSGEMCRKFKIRRTRHAYGYASVWEGRKEVWVAMYEPSPVRVYALVVHLRSLFHLEMLSTAQRKLLNGFTAKESLSAFLKSYGITEHDYKLERAYKRWQRSQQYEEARRAMIYGIR